MTDSTADVNEAVGRMDLKEKEEKAVVEEKNNEETMSEKDDADDMPELIGGRTSTENQDNNEDDSSLPPLHGVDNNMSSTDTDDSDAGIQPNQVEELLIQATNHKEEGNEYFKDGDLDQAARSYRRGTNALKKVNKNNTGDEQTKALLIALQNNLSMVCFRQSKFRMSADVATNALAIDPTNVKALYRRAVANRKMGNLEKSRSDLKQAIGQDPSNSACKKELLAVKKELEQSKENQKKALAKAFQKSGSSFLYNDKEAEEKRKEEQRERRRKQEQELYKKRKQEWEDECVKRMASNKSAISFEEWEKEQKEAEEQKRKEEEERQKQEEKRKKEERRKSQQAAKAILQELHDSDDDDDELTEQELAMMRGYKKTKDGRTTSYFTRELSEDEKKHIGDIAPKRLDQSVTSNAPQRLSSVTEGASQPSAWNQAGTWEEKDCTAWCMEQLRKRLQDTTATSKCDADITSVEELTGDASVAITGGKKRYIFDFHAKLKYEFTDLEEGEKVATGTIRLPDICSTSHDELEVAFEGWTKRPSKDLEDHAMETRRALAEAIRVNVRRWVQDFNEQY